MDICVDNANRAIFNAANSNPQYAGMGTTLVVGVFRDNRLLLGHIGDSRCYRLRAGRLEQITHDHSLLQEQIDAGPHHRRAGRVLGEQEPGDARASASRTPCCSRRTCTTSMPGDIYLLCSDGLSDMLDDEAIGAAVAELRLTAGSRQRADRRGQRGGRKG